MRALPKALSLSVLSAVTIFACTPIDATEGSADQASTTPRAPEIQLGVAVSPSQTALDTFFVNLENRPVSCETLKFTAPVASLDMCSSPLATQPITVKKVTFDANATRTFREGQTPGALGAAELTTLSTVLGKSNLVYCAPSPALQEADCGFACEQNGALHNYGDEWGVETINGTGERKWTCNAFGEPTISAICAVIDGQKKRPNDTWSVSVDNGTILKTCLSTGDIQSSPQCNPGFELSADHASCGPASCNGVPSGGAITTRTAPNGHYEALCDHGNQTNEHLVCNADFVISNEACVPRPRKSCGTHPDGDTWTSSDCMGAYESVVTNHCSDGVYSKVSERLRTPKRFCP